MTVDGTSEAVEARSWFDLEASGYFRLIVERTGAGLMRDARVLRVWRGRKKAAKRHKNHKNERFKGTDFDNPRMPSAHLRTLDVLGAPVPGGPR